MTGTSDITHAKISAIRTNAAFAGDTDLSFSTDYNGSVSDKLRILSNGNVGIGTTAPGYPLHVYKSASNVNEMIQADANYSSILYLGNTTTGIYRPGNTTDLRFFRVRQMC